MINFPSDGIAAQTVFLCTEEGRFCCPSVDLRGAGDAAGLPKAPGMCTAAFAGLSGAPEWMCAAVFAGLPWSAGDVYCCICRPFPEHRGGCVLLLLPVFYGGFRVFRKESSRRIPMEQRIIS